MMRRHRGAGAYAKAGANPLPESVSLIRTFNLETNPSRPIRPSPLTNSTIQGMPLDMLDRIRSFPLFRSAPEAFLTTIGTHLRPQMHNPHDYILTEGDDAKAMYWLVRGAVAVTSRDGESTYAELKPGAFFGEIGVLMGIPRTATIIARQRCLLVVLKKEDLAKELPKFPDVERTIREEAQERLSILERKKESLASQRRSPPTGGGRGEKRPRELEDAETARYATDGTTTSRGTNNKKRKSPSPGLVEVAASSALGSGLVNVRQLLKELPLFAALPAEILHFLGSNARQCTYPPFTDIIKQGSQGREVFFIVRGEVEVIDEMAAVHGSRTSKNGIGHKISSGAQVKARLRQGQYFGEVASLSLAPRRTATVRSVSSVECLLITGDVLSEFWTRCPAVIKEQIERTAKQRLRSTGDNDVVMADVADSTPRIDELAIGDRVPKTPKKPRIPQVTFDYGKPESPHKPCRIEDRPILEPFDPDPFLGAEFDMIRSRSRRSSLAPPSPEAVEDGKEQASSGRSTSPMSSKHVMNSSDALLKPKRPKTQTRKPSQFGKGFLSNTILVLIFSHLDLHELMHLRLVSLHWSKLLRESPELLHHLDLARYNRKVTDEVLINKICPFVGARPRHIDISNCFHMSDDGFTALAKVCGTKVTSWKMKSVWDVTAPAVVEMVKSAKALESLDLSNCRKVNDNLLAHIIGNVPPQPSPLSALYSYNIRATPSRPVGPVSTPAPIVQGSQKLRKLTLSYCKHVTDRSMNQIATYAWGRLEEIDLTRCTTITDHGFQAWGQHQFSRLRKLCLADCTYLTDSAIVYLTNAAKGLRDLDLVRHLILSNAITTRRLN